MRPSKEDRIKFNVDYATDSEFSAYARLLQSKWRVAKGFPEGKYGNYLETEFAKNTKSNFLTENIRNLVTQEIANAKKSGGLIVQPRIWDNLLSSQPLCFNLFGELYYDLKLATMYFKILFPNRLEKATAIKFEYSPGRGNSKYIGDHSAFDVFIEYENEGKKGFIGIEVKYAENLKSPDKYFKEQYKILTNSCGYFKPDCVDSLKHPPLSQIWRDHLLCIATKQDYDEGFFVFLFPSKNKDCKIAVDKYEECLSFDNEEQNCFYPRHLEEFINVLSDISTENWTRELRSRYLGD